MYSTYLGGSDQDIPWSASVDKVGSVVLAGRTLSTDFPTVNPLQPFYGGGIQDGFVTKLNAAGTALDYSTYLGGSGEDDSFAVALDVAGQVHVIGETASPNFPTLNPLQPSLAGGRDAVLSKITPAGVLSYSTYLGGATGDEYGTGIAVDAGGNMYLSGITSSTDFPTVNPLQPLNAGGMFDAFVAKLNLTGGALIYSTYLGGSGNEGLNFVSPDIIVDQAGSVFVMGRTDSLDFPTAAAFQPSFGGGSTDAYITKLTADGDAALFSTYLGGSAQDNDGGLVLDDAGNVVIAGSTGSTDFPTVNALQSAFGGGLTDAFVAKICNDPPVGITPGTWRVTGAMSAGRKTHTATLLADGQVLVTGGDQISTVFSSAELYDSTSGIFSITGSLGNIRTQHTATRLSNGQVLIVGGQTFGTSVPDVYDSAELYDPPTGTFTPTSGSMGTARTGHTATLLADGKVLIAGGFIAGPSLTSAELFDPSTGSFSSTGSMTTARALHQAIRLSNGHVLLVGGIDGTTNLASAELYDPDTGIFTATGSMAIARGAHTATLLANGHVLVAGGIDGTEGVSSAEVYDPVNGTFSSTGDMTTVRRLHQAILLSTGQVLVAGGRGILGGPRLDSVELYDPESGTWALTGSMGEIRSGGHSLTLLASGQIVAIGGSSTPGGLILSTAELYTPNLCGPEIDLSVSVVDNPDPVIVGDTLLYQVDVTNNNPDIDAANVVVTKTLPPDTIFDAGNSSGSCSESLGVVTCNVGAITQLNTAMVNIGVMVNGSPRILPYSVDAMHTDEFDPDFGNNRVSAQTIVQSDETPEADLDLTITDTPDPVALTPGTYSYTLNLNNNGPDVAIDAEVTATLPPGITLDSADPATGSCNGTGTVTCNLGDLDVLASTQIILNVTANSVGTHTLMATASADASVPDPSPTNNTNIAESTSVGNAIFTVTHDDDVDDGTCNATHCSLREAINAANGTPQLDVVQFNVFGGGNQTISPTIGGLPTITQHVIIDGTTQPGFAGTPIIQLDGSGAGAGASGLVITAAGSESAVKGLVINRFGLHGIWLQGGSNVRVAGNYLGTNVGGNTAAGFGNGDNGVYLSNGAANNTIGGTTVSARNIISGNGDGIHLIGGATLNVIQGNFIGTDVSGTQDLGNTLRGIQFETDAPNNCVGGSLPGIPGDPCIAPFGGNVISGNDNVGILLSGPTVTGNAIAGNFIGTNAVGDTALPNTVAGVNINGASGNIIGGLTSLERNVIAGNTGANIGITASSGPAQTNVIQGNYIGINADGTAALVNGAEGILLTSGASNNIIGGTTPGARNIISGNAVQGVHISGSGTNGNTVAGNYIGTDVNGTGALPNGNNGVAILLAATNNVIGGTAVGAGNVLSGNGQYGLTMLNAGTTGNRVEGNTIGLNAPQTALLGNFCEGIVLTQSASGNVIGGPLPGARNLIMGNNQAGLVVINGSSNNTIQNNVLSDNGQNVSSCPGPSGQGLALIQSVGPAVTGNMVLGNLIGTDVTGTTPRPNAWQGIAINDSSGNTIGGTTVADRNIISGNSIHGVLIQGALSTGNTVLGNYIGVAGNGTDPLPNAQDGVHVDLGANNNTIGGTVAGSRNVISGNGLSGVHIGLSGTTANNIQGNFIGTDVSGAIAVPNTGDGVHIRGASNNTVGGSGGTTFGSCAGACNVISGNTQSGVEIKVFPGQLTADANQVVGNFVGVDATGDQPLGNGTQGILLFVENQPGEITNTVIGGLSAGDGNIISANGQNGIATVITFGVAGIIDGTVIQGNLIGTDANGLEGVAGMGNTFDGIALDSRNIGLVTNTEVGPDNVIAFNGQRGVQITNDGATSNRLFSNSIKNNGGLGIDLGGPNVTANDPGDVDTGSNNLQNFPVLTSATIAATTMVTGSLNSSANTAFGIEFFSNPSCDASGHGEGEVSLGSTNVTTDGSGNVSFTASLPVVATVGHVVTATATDPGNNTSEFSACQTVVAGPNTFVVNSTADDGDADTGDNICQTAGGACTLRAAIQQGNNTPNDPSGPDVIAFNILGAGPHSIVPTVDLPFITEATTIDGYTQPGSSPNTLLVGNDAVLMIEIDGSQAFTTPSTPNGFVLASGTSNSTIRGLVINRFDQSGVVIIESGGNVIEGNFIGTNVTGTAAEANKDYGVVIISNFSNPPGTSNTTNNRIGGLSPAARNLISGNLLRGITLNGDVTNTLIQGNYIGTNVAGMAAIPNGQEGIGIGGAQIGPNAFIAANNRVGGTDTSARNLISGNSGGGIRFYTNADGNYVEGNYIGTDRVGLILLGNTGSGVRLGDAENNTIGGTDSDARNIISGNTGHGVLLEILSSGNIVQGNYIGTDFTGMVDLGNTQNGVAITDAPTNTIGGLTAAARNVISGNAQHGVLLNQAGTTGNVVQGNFIGTTSDGATALPNGNTGVVLATGAHTNTIGGNTAGAGNVLSGNGVYGIYMGDAGTTGNRVEGNIIGLNASQTGLLGNFCEGMILDTNASGNIIGGPLPGARNFIMGNNQSGVATLGGASNNTIQGNVISDNGQNTSSCDPNGGGAGVGISFGTGNVVIGNLIGTDPTGLPRPNSTQGVLITNASGNTIGGLTPADRNIISGNFSRGVIIQGALSTGNTVQGNYIGTNPAGMASLPNGHNGVELSQGVSNNTIGGTAAGAGNLISGNTLRGIDIRDSGTTNNVVQGNFIGTNAVGTGAIANGENGITVQNGASGNTIGGLTPADRNIISGNTVHGIAIGSIGTTNNVVQGNYIGTNAAGDGAIANGQFGVIISFASGNTIGGTTGTTPGVACAGACNLISGNTQTGVHIAQATATGNLVQGNFIGTDATGNTDLGNGIHGLQIVSGANTNTVGGTTPGAGNVISGNTGAQGVVLDGAGTSNNTVQGNLIGTNAAGTGAVPNGQGGVLVTNGSSNNTIGGNTAAARNILSGNTLDGVLLQNGATGNSIQGNYIGVQADGLGVLANNRNGVTIFDSPNNTIGGSGAGTGNVISANGVNGVEMTGSGGGATTGNVVRGNLVGLAADGSTPRGNGATGVQLNQNASNNTIGGSGAGTGNTIAFNGANGFDGDGVLVTVTGGVSNAILGNAIFSNFNNGIDLINDGVTANDVGDGDAGPNGLQNYPELTAALLNGTNLTVIGSLPTTPLTSGYTVEWFANTSCNASAPNDFGEGERFLGSTTNVTTDGSGNAALNEVLTVTPAQVLLGYFITATATDSDGNTSEFSQCQLVLGPTDAETSTVDTNVSSVLANGVNTATITVTVRDGAGSPLAGHTVSLAQSAGGNSTISVPSGPSDSNGVVAFTVTDTTVQSVIYSATDTTEGVTLTDTAVVDFVPAGLSVSNSTLETNTATVVANGVSAATITVTLLDAASVPISGHTVSLAQSVGGSSAISAPSGPSDSNGHVSFTVTNTTVQSVTYTATDTTEGVTLTDTAAVSYVASTTNASASTVDTNTATVLVNGVSTALITVTLLDSDSIPLVGHLVSLAQTAGASSTISAPSGPSDTNGRVTFSVSNLVVETVTYTATDTTDAVTITDTALVNFIAATSSAAASTVNTDVSSVLANGVSDATITVRLLDAVNVPLVGHTVSLAQNTGGNSTISAPSGSSDSNGQVTFTVSNATVQTVTYTATDITDSVVLTNTAVVTFVVPGTDAFQSSVMTSAVTLPADGTTSATITVTLRDASGQPVVGHSVSVTDGGAGSSISTPSGPSNSNGAVTFTVTHTQPETVTYSGTDITDGIAINNSAMVTFIQIANNAPTVAVPLGTEIVDEDAVNSALDLSANFADPDAGDALTLTVTGNSNPGLTTPNLVGTTLTLAYLANQHGIAGITVRATDGEGLFVEDVLEVTVNPVPDAPTVIAPGIPDQPVTAGNPPSPPQTVIDLSTHFTDADIATDGDTLTFSVVGNTNPSVVSTSITGNQLTLTYGLNQPAGTATVTVEAQDTTTPIPLKRTDTFDVVMESPVPPPTFSLQLALTEDLGMWLPSVGAPVTITGTILQNGLPLSPQPTVTFSVPSSWQGVPNPTQEPGAYTNDPNQSATPDFTTQNLGSNQFRVTAQDYGGRIRIEASSTFTNPTSGATVMRTAGVTLPRDTDHDQLGDVWENQHGGLNLTVGQDTDASLGSTTNGDGLTAKEEYRGFIWGPHLVPIATVGSTATYQTAGFVLDPTFVPGSTPTPHMRGNPTRKDLFFDVTNYDVPGFNAACDCPFAIGVAYDQSLIDLHVRSTNVAEPLAGDAHIDVVHLENRDDIVNRVSGDDGHLNRGGPRNWSWDRKGESCRGTATVYAAVNALGNACGTPFTETYQQPLDNYFSDRPYLDGTTYEGGAPVGGPNGLLDPPNEVFVPPDPDGAGGFAWLYQPFSPTPTAGTLNDGSADGPGGVLADVGILKLTGTCADAADPTSGDYFRFGCWAHTPGGTAVDINANGRVELGANVSEQPEDDLSGSEATKAQVLKQTITHELGHAVGIEHNNANTACVMPANTYGWNRDACLSSTSQSQLLIHND